MSGKRGNGEGSISRRRNGGWMAQYFVHAEGGRKKRRTVYGKPRNRAVHPSRADRVGTILLYAPCQSDEAENELSKPYGSSAAPLYGLLRAIGARQEELEVGAPVLPIGINGRRASERGSAAEPPRSGNLGIRR